MFLVRDIMYCKPGKARPMVDKMKALTKLNKELGFGEMRVMTDVSAERYWTLVSEMEVESLDEFMSSMSNPPKGASQDDMKKMDLNRLRAGQRDQAVHEVKASLLLDKIADAEKIEVGDEEIDREIEALAQQSKQTPEAIRARLTRDGALDRIRNRIRNEKTLNFLYHQSA